MFTRRRLLIAVSLSAFWLASGSSSIARQLRKKSELEPPVKRIVTDDKAQAERLEKEAEVETARLLKKLIPEPTFGELLKDFSGFSDKDKPTTLTLKDAFALAIVRERAGKNAPRITSIDAKTINDLRKSYKLLDVASIRTALLATEGIRFKFSNPAERYVEVLLKFQAAIEAARLTSGSEKLLWDRGGVRG